MKDWYLHDVDWMAGMSADEAAYCHNVESFGLQLSGRIKQHTRNNNNARESEYEGCLEIFL